MKCLKTPKMFFSMKPDKDMNSHRTPDQLKDSEILNKICEGVRGARGDCRSCNEDDMCVYGKEALKRGLV